MPIPTNTNLCYDCDDVRTIKNMGYCNKHKKDLQYLGVYGTDKKNLYYKTYKCPHLNDAEPPITYSDITVTVKVPDGKYCKDCQFIYDNEHDGYLGCSITGNELSTIKIERIVQVTKDISDKKERYEHIKDRDCPNDSR